MLSKEEVNKFLEGIGENLYIRKPFATGLGHQGVRHDAGELGEYNEKWRVYTTSDPDLFWKVTLKSDSYGNNDSIHSIKLVEKIVKEVSCYE